MKFRFDVNLSERDYVDYNLFHLTKSPYGKKQLFPLRVMIAVLTVLLAVRALVEYGFTAEGLIQAIAPIFIFTVLQLLLKPLFSVFTRVAVKSMKKTGKPAYSPTSVIEFDEDSFTETTPENRIEQKYSSVERISIIKDRFVYIHINNIMAYIIPMASFENREEYDAFIGFIKTKCGSIDIY